MNVQTTVQKSISKTRDPPATLQISRWIPLPHKCIDGPGKVMGNKARSHYVETEECILVKASVKIYCQLTSRPPRNSVSAAVVAEQKETRVRDFQP